MPAVTDPNVLVELSTADDAAVYRITDDIAAVLTVDFFTPLVDDAYEFGRIAVTNALSDVYAMGARPVIALNLVAYPARTRPLDVLEQILRGGADQAAAAGVSIVGGHSIDDPEPKYGLAVMGLVNPAEVLTNAGAKVGDRLIFTKPIGTGIIATAIKKGISPAEVTARTIEVMTTLNAAASEVMRRVGCHACTDVTGFGLLGHLHEITAASGVGARVRFRDVPLIDGVRELVKLDIAPGGTEANLEFLSTGGAVVWEDNLPEDYQLLLCDAQTAGGLLMSVAPDDSDRMIEELHVAGVSAAADIGEVIPDPECRVRVAL
jgi:selenide,water dikinase